MILSYGGKERCRAVQNKNNTYYTNMVLSRNVSTAIVVGYERLLTRMSEPERQVEELFESLLAKSFG